MNDWKQYYEERLYPLQNGILKCVKDSRTRFFLTGGTALSRGYFNHRYSDDLDLFVENEPDFRDQAEDVINTLKKNGFIINRKNAVVAGDYFSFPVKRTGDESNTDIRVDLVNDIAIRFGTLQDTPVYYRTDDWRNILSNKLCALLRLEIKDFADIYTIAGNRPFSWDQILDEAREKETGLEPAVLADLLKTVPEQRFDTIRWRVPPTWEEFREGLDQVVEDMLAGRDNSLVRGIREQGKGKREK